MLNIQLQPLAVSLAYPDVQDEHLEICRLLAAATVNPAFCRLLLDDPELALRTGYQGESFLLTRAERDLVLSIGAASLEDLAWEICRALGQRTACIASTPVDALQGFAL